MIEQYQKPRQTEFEQVFPNRIRKYLKYTSPIWAPFLALTLHYNGLMYGATTNIMFNKGLSERVIEKEISNGSASLSILILDKEVKLEGKVKKILFDLTKPGRELAYWLHGVK